MRQGQQLRRLWVALTLAVAVSAAGCAPVSSSSASNSTETVDSDLVSFYDQQLRWSSCGDDSQCADMTVPLDWAEPTGDTIQIAVTRHQSGSSNGRALVMNPGGPGAASLDYVRVQQYRDYFFGDALSNAFDLVTFDPRGVGESTAVRCYDAADTDSYLFDLPENARGTDAYIAEVTQAAEAFGQACVDNTGALLGHVDTASVARDLDVLRAVLGQSTLNYLGYSYGTRIGSSYAELFPEQVGAFVLDGAIDPSLSAEDTLVEQVSGFDQATRSFLSDCLQATSCPFSASDADGAATQLAALVSALDDQPLQADDGRRLGSSSMLTAISAALYSRLQWPTLRKAITQVQQGNADLAMQLVDSYYGRTDGTYDDNSFEAQQAVNCLDLPTDHSEGAGERLSERLRQASSIFGPFYADGTTMCLGWPESATGTAHRVTADGAAPIMVIGTTGDPATPYAWAESLADQLSSGFLVTNVGEGHTAYRALASTCITNAVESFLVDGTKPQDDLRCT